MKTLVIGFIGELAPTGTINQKEVASNIELYLERYLDAEMQRKSGFDKLRIVTGPANHTVSATVREVAKKLNIPCSVGDGWGASGSRFYRECDVLTQYGDAGDAWCKQQEEDFRRTKPDNPFHFLF